MTGSGGRQLPTAGGLARDSRPRHCEVSGCLYPRASATFRGFRARAQQSLA